MGCQTLRVLLAILSCSFSLHCVSVKTSSRGSKDSQGCRCPLKTCALTLDFLGFPTGSNSCTFRVVSLLVSVLIILNVVCKSRPSCTLLGNSCVLGSGYLKRMETTSFGVTWIVKSILLPVFSSGCPSIAVRYLAACLPL